MAREPSCDLVSSRLHRNRKASDELRDSVSRVCVTAVDVACVTPRVPQIQSAPHPIGR